MVGNLFLLAMGVFYWNSLMLNKKEMKALQTAAWSSRCSRKFIQLRKDDFKVMSRDAVLFISYLANIKQNHELDKDTKKLKWIFSTIKTIEEKIKMGRRTQNRIIKELEAKEFLQITLRGKPAMRYFFVNWAEIELAIQDCGESCEIDDDGWPV